MTVPLLVALGIGAAIALQAATVGHLSGEVHPLTISLALLLSGVAVASTWASVRHAWPEVLAVTGRWWWVPLGIAGWVIVAALGWTASRLGVAVALAVVVGSQADGRTGRRRRTGHRDGELASGRRGHPRRRGGSAAELERGREVTPRTE